MEFAFPPVHDLDAIASRRRGAVTSVARAAPLAAAIVLFVVGALRLARTLTLTMNSDTLYLAALYRDIFIDKIPIRAWHVQPAPSFFPDLPAFFVLRALTGDAARTVYAYGLCELLAEAALFACLLRHLGVKGRSTAWSTALATFGAIAYLGSFGDSLHAMFHPSCHSSTVWIALGSAVLVTRQIERGKPSLLGVLVLLVINALTGGFDKLYILVGTLPLLGALLLALVFLRRSRSVAFANAAALQAAVVLATRIETLPARIGMVVPPTIPQPIWAWSAVARVLSFFPPPDHEPAIFMLQEVLIGTSAAIALVVVARWMIGRRPAGLADLEVAPVLAAAYFGSLTCNFLGVAVCQSYWDPTCFRYLQSLFVLPYLVVAAWFALASSYVLRGAVAVGLLSILRPWPTPTPAKQAAAGVDVFYPPDAACVDRVARAHGATYGFADYWHARWLSELSRGGLSLLPLKQSFFYPDLWIANPEAFRRPLPSAPSFMVILTGFDEAQVRSRLGNPALVETCSKGEVWIYPSPPRWRPSI
jgi:hypothetical protein